MRTQALFAMLGIALTAQGCDRHEEEKRIAAALAMQNDSVPVLVGAGDIAQCSSPGAAQTAALLDGIRGTIFIAGDAAYATRKHPDPFSDCYDATWGRHRARTRPSPGNHEYDDKYDPKADRYYAYFGELAGPRRKGYYSYELGTWHVIALNTAIPFEPGTDQHTWLVSDLNAHLGKCTIAYMHHPRFSSGPHDEQDRLVPLWRTFSQYGLSVVVAGHDHIYERFQPMDAEGKPDSTHGIRQFVAGMGGASKYEIKRRAPGSEVNSSEGFGVLKLSLLDQRYRWQFIPASPNTFHDSGVSTCRPTHAAD